MITMECLPSDIVLDILSRLPVESVLDCKLVCKRLLKLLSDRWNQFAKMHHQQQLLQLASYGGDAYYSSTGLLFSFEKYKKDETRSIRLYYGDKYNVEMNIHENFSYETLHETSISCPVVGTYIIAGSYFGLICLVRYHHHIPEPIHICNPVTGEYVNLPEYTLREEYYGAAYGFGYVHSMTNVQYKVVRIYYPDSDYNIGEVQVYTIGNGSGWRTIGRTSYRLHSQTPLGVYVNGYLHWIDKKKIVAFNLADEEFRLIQSPPYCDPPHNCSTCFDMLQVLRGNLCLCHQRNEEHLLDIWSLKKNATEASWTRDFSIAYQSSLDIDHQFPVWPLLITVKNEVLFVHQGDMLCCYDPRTNMVIELWEDKKQELNRLHASPHMNSFVSLKALGERSETKKKLRHRSLEDTD
ncbi:hypothetical protein MKW94_018367 [Papaver nudicaule]|uniref:F-box domain-containing protein n=1 Tax=Papaver nudicaule TaxID=74823 RepID=A0AA41S6S0_PAPNU|nr:hypothetical protein [Papaver nudicaule]